MPRWHLDIMSDRISTVIAALAYSTNPGCAQPAFVSKSSLISNRKSLYVKLYVLIQDLIQIVSVDHRQRDGQCVLGHREHRLVA